MGLSTFNFFAANKPFTARLFLAVLFLIRIHLSEYSTAGYTEGMSTASSVTSESSASTKRAAGLETASWLIVLGPVIISWVSIDMQNRA
jgi:hypothetical protein